MMIQRSKNKNDIHFSSLNTVLIFSEIMGPYTANLIVRGVLSFKTK